MSDWREIMATPIGVTGLRKPTHNTQNSTADKGSADIADIAYGKRGAVDGAPDRDCAAPKVAEVAAAQSRDADPEAIRVARLDAERHERDKADGRGYDYAGSPCPFCLNDPARCAWCADHAGDPGAISCGDCERGRMTPVGVGWRRNIVPDSTHPIIPPAIRAKIESIETEARALGWDPERLWNSNFRDQPRGLPAVMDEPDEIGAVTADYIEILKTQKNVLRFRRQAS